MSNSTECIPSLIYKAPPNFSCLGATGPYSVNVTSDEHPAANQTGQAVKDALNACCPLDVVQSTEPGPDSCYSYCANNDKEQALKTQNCLDNYAAGHPDYFFGNLKCNIPSGATMLGRTSGWGGLVILGLVVSAAATMM
ncbi:hypothetical protein V495_01478 [Pseudogymnoascus sp. VKM F-4514 (FW-929)]|nr:hypothetical protein V495_01478 [Pseudogymnoascus sp. VKM F-4514 (FW-929)]KFY55777.1 hypothetical protein V497_06748 [Pseudogymnoascus sp. VKM F-4516 (FW-969)]